jgi:hypothetical protein
MGLIAVQIKVAGFGGYFICSNDVPTVVLI